MATQTIIRSSSQLYIDKDLNFNGNKASNMAAGTLGTDGVILSQMTTAISNALIGFGAIHTPVQSLVLAVAVPAIERLDKMIMLIEDLGLYHYDAQSSATSNNGTIANVIRPTDIGSDATPGRWIKMSSVMTDHNSLTSLQGDGGVGSNEYYHLNAAEYTGTGSGVFARKTSPIFITPNVGAASADSINGLIITGTTGTFSLTNSKTFTVQHTITLTSADDTSVITLPSGNKTLVATDQQFWIGSTLMTVSRASANLALTGISSVGYINGSYTATLSPVVMAGSIALTLPALAGALVGTGDTGTVTGTMILDGTIQNSEISATAAIAITKLASYTISGVSLGGNLFTLTFGAGLSGTSYNGSSAVTIGLAANVMLTDAVQTVTANKTFNTGTLISTNQIINGVVSGTGVAIVATINTLALRDGNGNSSFVNVLEGYSTTVTVGAANTILSVNSGFLQFFTGSASQIVTLPVASTLVLGQQYRICNNGTGHLTINSSGALTIIILAPGSDVLLTCILASGTTAASWDFRYLATTILTDQSLTINKTITFDAAAAGYTITFSQTGTITSTAFTALSLIAQIDGAGLNTNIKSITGLTTALTVNQGGTGSTSYAVNGASWLLKAGTGTTAFVTASAADVVAAIGATAVQLATTATTANKVANALTAGTGISAAGTFDGSAARTFSLDTVYMGNNYAGLVGSRRTYRMIPTTGVVNGSNTVFTWNPPTVAAIISGSEEIYVNGILFNAGALNDYTVVYGSGPNFTMTVTFLTAPSNTPFVDIIMANFSV